MDPTTSNILNKFPIDSIKINISNKNIKGILNLKKYDKLIELDCSNNQLTQIINISPSLKILNCSNNLIKKITTTFNFFNNPKIYNDKIIIKLLKDITFFPPYIKKIICPNNKIEGVVFVNRDTEYMYCSNNLIKRIIPIKTENRQTLHSYYKIDSLRDFLCSIKIDYHRTISIKEDNYFNYHMKYFNANSNPLVETLITSYTKSHYLPSTLKNLSVYKTHNRDINFDISHTNINNLYIGDLFNKPIDNLPKSLTSIVFHKDCWFNQSVDDLPAQLKYLTLGDDFSHPVDNLPISLLNLKIGSKFNHPVDNLPTNLKQLVLGYSFNQPIDNLPPQLIHLALGSNFNQPIDKLPSTLIYLELNGNFNQPINNLPAGLLHLGLNGRFNQPIDNLPKDLEFLFLDSNCYQTTNNLPPKLIREKEIYGLGYERKRLFDIGN